jgi:exodeoxyribonuclease-3
MLAFPRNKGFRIDHAFCTPAVAARVTSVTVDREARKGQGASDHAPLVVEIDTLAP